MTPVSLPFVELQNHTMVGLEGTSEPSQPHFLPCVGCSLLAEAAQDTIQPGLGMPPGMEEYAASLGSLFMTL